MSMRFWIWITICFLFFEGSNAIQCNVTHYNNITLVFPYQSREVKYTINFNKTIMQPNYVYYISTEGGHSCEGCKFREDPYKIDILVSKDYNKSNYDRGHLVPNADFGHDTFVMPNVVPMVPNFNRDAWAMSEEYIRKKYHGQLVYKGCDYSLNKYFISILKKKVYVPNGCYYVVFDHTYNLLDYGYFLNQKKSTKMNKLPSWVICNKN